MQTPPISSGRLISAIRVVRALEQQRGQHHGGTDGDDIGFEQVGRHAGAVAHVVTNVVGDHRRVAWIVFGDAGFDLADQVGADVSRLGEDPAAQTREDRDQRGAEGKGDQAVNHGAVIAADGVAGQGRSGTRRTPQSRAARGRPPACR